MCQPIISEAGENARAMHLNKDERNPSLIINSDRSANFMGVRAYSEKHFD